MYTGSDFDWRFKTANLNSLTSVTLTMFGSSTFEYSLKKFEFRCNGALAPTIALADSNKVNVKWVASTLGEVANLDDKNYDTATSVRSSKDTTEKLQDPEFGSSYTFTFSSLGKTWADVGMESVYTIAMKVQGPDVIKAGNWFVIEFSRDIAPKLNRLGKLNCDQGYNSTLTPAYCEFAGDRKVKILS